eukprot:gene4574-biopygen12678
MISRGCSRPRGISSFDSSSIP